MKNQIGKTRNSQSIDEKQWIIQSQAFCAARLNRNQRSIIVDPAKSNSAQVCPYLFNKQPIEWLQPHRSHLLITAGGRSIGRRRFVIRNTLLATVQVFVTSQTLESPFQAALLLTQSGEL